MSAITTEQLQGCSTNGSIDTESIAEILTSFEQRIQQLEDENEQQQQQIQQLEDELEAERQQRGKDDCAIKSRVSDLEDDIEADTPTPDTGETPTRKADLTPIEQLSQADDVAEVTESASVKRAVSLFTNLAQWGSKTPKGFVLKPADNPLSLLEADSDESLCWKQYYRAAKTLEKMSKGAVTFFDSDRHGKMLVLHKQSETYSRMVNGSLSSSSVETSA